VAISGALDIITDGKGRAVTVGGGSELLTKITGAGCALSALVAAFLGACPRMPFEAAVAACATMSCAAEGSPHSDPGNLRVHLLARLHTIGPQDLLVACRTRAIEAVSGEENGSAAAGEGCAVTLSVASLDARAAEEEMQMLFQPVVVSLVTGYSGLADETQGADTASTDLICRVKQAVDCLVAVTDGGCTRTCTQIALSLACALSLARALSHPSTPQRVSRGHQNLFISLCTRPAPLPPPRLAPFPPSPSHTAHSDRSVTRPDPICL
jgi:hypothetical protein